MLGKHAAEREKEMLGVIAEHGEISGHRLQKLLPDWSYDILNLTMTDLVKSDFVRPSALHYACKITDKGKAFIENLEKSA